MKKRKINNGVMEILNKENYCILSVSEKAVDDMIHVCVSGRIITEAAHEFEDELMACITVCKRIVLDFENVTHISSMGLNTLLSVQRILDDDPYSFFKIINVNSEVYQEFKDVGFHELLIIEQANR